MLAPGAESLVGRWRADWDPSAAAGVPAHVTVLWPFVSAEQLDEEVEAALAELFAAHEPFDYELVDVRRFPPGVVYLAPEPPAPFRSLTEAVVKRWPEHPPYEGRHGEPTPHLTVAQVDDAIRADALASEVAIGSEMALPLELRCRDVALLVENGGQWSERRRFPLGGRTN